MKCVLTLADVIFTLCQDEDVLVRVVDYETGTRLIDAAWKSDIHKNDGNNDYYIYKSCEVMSISPCQFNGNIGFEITIIYF